jgi:Zn-dependent M28 family amino/carboxypeptidase
MADADRLGAHVAALQGPRHPLTDSAALARAQRYVAETLARLGLPVEERPFRFRGQLYQNVVARLEGRDPKRPRVLVGAHFDSVPGTPGADDNASGVAGLLEVARALERWSPAASIDFVGFNLEEPQGGLAYRVGSAAFARDARRRGERYAGALILEMVGYTDARPRSQQVPAALFWKRVPKTGTFLAATGDWRSRGLLRAFARIARRAVPELEVVTLRTPLRGWLVPQTRLSDNASFWDAGYPALMLTDTAFLRNPWYHTTGDRLETLDFEFMARVVDAVAAVVRELAG